MASATKARVLSGKAGVEWKMNGAVAGKGKNFLVYRDGVRVASVTTGRDMSMVEIKALLREE